MDAEFQAEVVDILKGKAAEIFGADPATLSADTRFIEDLHCKSVNIVQFASALEDAATLTEGVHGDFHAASPAPFHRNCF